MSEHACIHIISRHVLLWRGLRSALQLEANSATLLLANCLDDDEGDEEAMTRAATKVKLDSAATLTFWKSIQSCPFSCIHRQMHWFLAW